MQQKSRRSFLAMTMFAGCAPFSRGLAATPLQPSRVNQPGRRQWPAEAVFGTLVCHADGELATLDPVLRELARLPTQINGQVATGTSEAPIHLFLFGNEATYRAYVQSHFPEAPLRRALYVKRGTAGMIFASRSAALAKDLRHEVTHAHLHETVAGLPLWLDEGMAEYYEMPGLQRRYGHPHQPEIMRALGQGWQPDLAMLENLSPRHPLGQRDYSQAWAWFHFFLHAEPGYRRSLVNFLADLRAGRPAGQLSHRLRSRPVFQDFRQHFLDRS